MELLTEQQILDKKIAISPNDGGVYFLIKDNKIVYTGQSGNLLLRLSNHWRSDFIEFDSFAFIQMPNSISLDRVEVEREYIKMFPNPDSRPYREQKMLSRNKIIEINIENELYKLRK